MMDLWTTLLDILVLLLAAMLLGSICLRLKQSAILGYLLAGTLLGPNALAWMPNHTAVATIAELGVALLLFTIGLEFSWARLRIIGPFALGGGTLQVLLTCALSAGVCLMLGLDGPAAVAIGCMIALSSTACVLRLLESRTEIDSVYGRNAVGILLLQDIAVVPLVLVVTALASDGSPAEVLWETGRAIGTATLLVGGLYLLLNVIVPPFFGTKQPGQNRELPILLAIITALGSAWASHQLDLPAVLGAFVAGLLLAASPFATQIRADVAPLRTLFVTLFFSSIGMLSNPAWMWAHGPAVLAVVAAIVVGKSLIVSAVAPPFGFSRRHAVATSLCLAQVGEFSIVLAETAQRGSLITNDLFEMVISATIVTLFLTPYLIAAAPHVGRAVSNFSTHGPRELHSTKPAENDDDDEIPAHVVIIGFGPSGRRAAETLQEISVPLVVVELNPQLATDAQALGYRTYIGDATRSEVVEHLRLDAAQAVAVSVPHPPTVRQIIERIRALSPDIPIVARSRYHRFRTDALVAGATIVVDEEEETGLQIGNQVKKILDALPPDPPTATSGRGDIQGKVGG